MVIKDDNEQYKRPNKSFEYAADIKSDIGYCSDNSDLTMKAMYTTKQSRYRTSKRKNRAIQFSTIKILNIKPIWMKKYDWNTSKIYPKGTEHKKYDYLTYQFTNFNSIRIVYHSFFALLALLS